MSNPGPALPASFEQQRKRAKDLLRAARRGDAGALTQIRAVRPDAGSSARPLSLADAQFASARALGFDSWPALVSALQARDVNAFREAVGAGDAPRTRELLAARHVRARINDPLFAFGQRAAHIAAEKGQTLLAVLIAAGADVQMTSAWDNGPFTVLDRADEPTARFLLSQGARLTPHVAARLGWLDELNALLEGNPALVHARGGDGRQPLHEANAVAVTDVLLDRGADIDARCVDHQSTPAQYALVDRPDVCRRLLERGATPDIFMAARLGDAQLAARIIDADPTCLSARINEPGYAPVPPLHIYCWTLGFGLSPHEVANRFGHRHVVDLLLANGPDPVRLLNAALTGDHRLLQDALDRDPAMLASLPAAMHAHLAHAIFYERFGVAELLLRVGFDPAAPGVDGGSALHAACWVGHVDLVERILATGRVQVDSRDATHGSTPLGWAAFGSVHRRAAAGDYPGVIDRLVAAGADISAAGNRAGRSLVEMAAGNAAVQAALRRAGAR